MAKKITKKDVDKMIELIKYDFGDNICAWHDGLCGRLFAQCILRASPDSIEVCYSLSEFMEDEGITDKAEAEKQLEKAFLLIFSQPFYDNAGIFSGALVAMDRRDEDARKFHFSVFCHEYLKKFGFIKSDEAEKTGA